MSKKTMLQCTLYRYKDLGATWYGTCNKEEYELVCAHPAVTVKGTSVTLTKQAMVRKMCANMDCTEVDFKKTYRLVITYGTPE